MALLVAEVDVGVAVVVEFVDAVVFLDCRSCCCFDCKSC